MAAIYIMDTDNTSIALNENDFQNVILFVEDMVEYVTPEQFGRFFDWLDRKGFLQLIHGIIIGEPTPYKP